MPVFKIVDGKLNELKVAPLDKEKSLQRLVEKNLPELLDMHFIASEYQTTHGGRIDTLAIDSKGAPVIIEYKRNKNDTVIPQALFYLNWLKSQKPEFFQMLVTEAINAEMAKNIDWKNPRIICIAESYNPYDVIALNEIPNLELHRYLYYEKDIFLLQNIKVEDEKPKNADRKISENKAIELTVEDFQIDLQMHLDKGELQVRKLFSILQEKILGLDESIEQKINNNYIAYKISKIFAEVHIQKKKILLYLRPSVNLDPEKRLDRIPDSYNWTLNQRIYIENENDVEYVMPLIEQSYKDVL